MTNTMAYGLTGDMQYTLFMGDPQDLIREREGNLVRGYIDAAPAAGTVKTQTEDPAPKARPTVEQMMARKPDGVFDTIWEHPEWGNYYVRPAAPPKGSFQHLYFEHIRDLILRKWRNLFPYCPIPGMSRIEILNDDDLEPGCPFEPVQGILIKLESCRANKTFLRLEKLKDSLAKNMCRCLEITKDQIAVSPFFEWELADFWEGGFYELD